MNQLADKLMQLEFDASYTSAEVRSYEGAKQHFIRYLFDVLKRLCDDAEADRGFIAIAGFKIGEYTPLAWCGYAPRSLKSLPTSGSDSPVAQVIHDPQPIAIIDGASSLASGDPASAIAQHIHLPLVGQGETIGFVCLERLSPNHFEKPAINRLREVAPLLTMLVAEQNFSIRVYHLAEPFQFQKQEENELGWLYEEIVERTALAFAADAVAIRIYDASNDYMPIKAYRGEIGNELLKERRPGEHIAGKLMFHPDHDWAAIADEVGNLPTGMPIDPVDREVLRANGVHACLIMRLASQASEEKEDALIGTLAYHMRRPHRFSWRDLALFRSFCHRVADGIALERQTMRLRKSKDDLELEHSILLAQTSQATNTDIVSLIAHDLFHKSFHACAALGEYTKRVEKAMRARGGDFSLIHADGEQAMDAATEIQATLGRLRAMQQSTSRMEVEPSSTFLLKEVVDEIENILGGPLNRNKIMIRRNFADSLSLFGPRSIFTPVLFNLVINSIDAARTRTTNRPMAIHIHAQKQPEGQRSETIVIQFWDEGPGINRQVFRDPQDVFKIGMTTKVYGTGTGLPVARHLLQKHFGGNIELLESERALFRVTVPMSNPTNTSGKDKK